MQSVGLNIPMVRSWVLSQPNYPALAGPLANGTLVVQAFSFEGATGKASEVRSAFTSQFKTDKIEFPNGVANSYDGMGLLAAAITKAGSTDKEKIRQALLDVEYDGLIKRYAKPFSDTDREALGVEDMFLTQVQGDKFVRIQA